MACPAGHQMVWSTQKNGMYSESGWKCDRCTGTGNNCSSAKGDAGRMLCGTCLYDVCDECTNEDVLTKSREAVVHDGILCDQCKSCPLRGNRFKARHRLDYDVCESCYSNFHPSLRPLYEFVPLEHGTSQLWCSGLVHPNMDCNACGACPLIGARFADMQTLEQVARYEPSSEWYALAASEQLYRPCSPAILPRLSPFSNHIVETAHLLLPGLHLLWLEIPT